MGSKRLVCVLLGITVLISAALAQTTEGAVSGTVTDPSGAHVAGAAVTAFNVGTGLGISTVTNSAGVYVFPSLPPGPYRIAAQHPGFRRAVIHEIELAVGSQISVNIDLDLGQASESVEVKASATEVNVSSARLAAPWNRAAFSISRWWDAVPMTC